MARSPIKVDEDREKSKKVGALRDLWPFLSPYKWLVVGAGLALVLTASVSLTLPLAVRRVVDNFRVSDSELLNLYFSAALVIAALLAVGYTLDEIPNDITGETFASVGRWIPRISVPSTTTVAGKGSG